MLEERRRLSGTALQESVSLLAELVLRSPPAKVEDGAEAPDPRKLVGPAAVELLRKKVRGFTRASMSAGAAALQQAIGGASPIAIAPQVVSWSEQSLEASNSTWD